MNTTIKRIIAIILAVMMITALVGCGKGKREVVQLTLSTEDAEAILRAAGIRTSRSRDGRRSQLCCPVVLMV